MKELNIEKFSVKKAELVEMMTAMKNIKINGIDDKVGYQAAKDAKSLCVSKRGEITTNGKAMRSKALQFQKDVIAHEKELIGIITPVEVVVKKMMQVVDDEKAVKRRKKLLPIRQAQLKMIETVATDELLLKMDADKFQEFFNECNDKFIKKQKEEADERERIAQEKLKKLEDELKEKEDLAKKALDEANEKIKKLEDDAKKKEQEAQAVKIFEKTEPEKPQPEVKKEESKPTPGKAEINLREKQIEIYNKFLKSNGWTEETKDNYLIKNVDGVINLYKIIDTLTLIK